MIISKTPLRISFSGGGTDISDFYNYEPGVVLSTAINKYIYIILNHRFQKGYRFCYSKVEEINGLNEIKHPLFRECLKSIPVPSCDISSLADIPKATGLGSSSSFTVGLLNVLAASRSKYLERGLLAEEACTIEIERLNEHIGKQDQYCATFGGLNLIEFEPDKVTVKPVLCELSVKDELNQSLLLFYTGIRREGTASEIIDTYDFKQKIDILKEMKDIAYEMKDILEEGKMIGDFGTLLDEAWNLKKKLSGKISNKEIDRIYNLGISAGAVGGKLLGSGDGGFILFFVEKQKKEKVRQALWPLQEIPFRFDPEGSRIVYVD